MLWCHFPEIPDTAPEPKPRPALVLGLVNREDGLSVKVIYGTSQRVDRLRAGGFAILRSLHPAAYALAGLSYDTKFDFGALVELPWSSLFFKVPPQARHGQTPNIGTLHPSLMRAARAAYESVKKV